MRRATMATVIGVEVGQLNYLTLSAGWFSTVWNSSASFTPGLWYRAAPWLDSDNSPGVHIDIGDSGSAQGRAGESVWIDENGNVNLAMTVVNSGKGTAAVGISWMVGGVGYFGVRDMVRDRKAHVLFDEEGSVGAILHPKESSAEESGFLPGPRQHTAILETPAELAHLKPRYLHDSVRIAHPRDVPRLIAKDERV
jgi:hypothetical protein